MAKDVFSKTLRENQEKVHVPRRTIDYYCIAEDKEGKSFITEATGKCRSEVMPEFQQWARMNELTITSVRTFQ
jgi:hypothetical protein